MIEYDKGGLGLWLLLQIAGTTWPSAVPPALLASGISLVMGLYEDVDLVTRDRDLFLGHPYAFQLFAVVVGSLLIFKTNSAYQRYWEAAGALQNMASKWLDGVCMAVSFDASGDAEHPYLQGACSERSTEPHAKTGSKGGPNHNSYVADLIHLCSLLHALALQHLRKDQDLDNLVTASERIRAPALQKSQSMISEWSIFSPEHISESHRAAKLPVIGGLEPEEREALGADTVGRPLPTDARIAMVEGWFMRRMIARQKHEQGDTSATAPPILSRLYQVISDGTLWYSTSAKSADIPFPFPYQNFVEVMVWLFSFLAPVVINGMVFDQVARTVGTFCVVLTYHAIKNTGDVLEDPYLPYDPNDLPLVNLQRSLNQRLLSLGVVPSAPGPSSCPSPKLDSLEAVDVVLAAEMREPVQVSKKVQAPKTHKANSSNSVSACLGCIPVTFGFAHLQAANFK
mmetsp:Transcript_71660/g.171118  ORF Transcript_71660/g.171118 Transcript_71660/m.171118 type:complete len:456 (+) Transcript_71660:59-1426(+)|eukprot:CAMPEP_0181451326 /NCGR_PEP_ID=MMETSP1110-20121109/28632_1 /TAXON_ID=174948 /ORGANISM="Symbiodinium sp., Strain CCMP421" /LENGTH=455 /DNA_ID=CAMNT_0023575571 /DNA_START=52 /DNA_END=1419 /DNA_ORIENTATION=-